MLLESARVRRWSRLKLSAKYERRFFEQRERDCMQRADVSCVFYLQVRVVIASISIRDGFFAHRFF